MFNFKRGCSVVKYKDDTDSKNVLGSYPVVHLLLKEMIPLVCLINQTLVITIITFNQYKALLITPTPTLVLLG